MSITKLICAAVALCLLHIPAAAHAQYATHVGWDNQLFPSFMLATAAIRNPDDAVDSHTLGDQFGLLGVTVTPTESNTPIVVTISCEQLLEDSEYRGVLPEAGVTYRINPKIRYRYNYLSQCRQATPTTVTFSVQLGDSEPTKTAITATVRAVNDCALAFEENGQAVDVTFSFAAFVNEQHPFVDKMLREALNLGVVERFTGYQSNDTEEVVRQVYALWDLLVARDVRYSDIATTAADSNMILSQHVRTIEDAINNGQANCIDGSVLLVSMLRKIGIDAILVFEPGHCYVGFYLDRKNEMLVGLETTAIDNVLDEPTDVFPLLDTSIPLEHRGSQSWPNFVLAITHACEKLKANGRTYDAKSDPNYRLINVAEARKRGVLPIPYTGEDTFVQYDYSQYLEESRTSAQSEDSDAEETETHPVSEVEGVPAEDSEVDLEDEAEDEDEDESEDEADY